jgi:hypothetical protein
MGMPPGNRRVLVSVPEGTSQGPTPEDVGKDDHICGRSKSFMKYPGFIIFDTALSFVSK